MFRLNGTFNEERQAAINRLVHKLSVEYNELLADITVPKYTDYATLCEKSLTAAYQACKTLLKGQPEEFLSDVKTQFINMIKRKHKMWYRVHMRKNYLENNPPTHNFDKIPFIPGSDQYKVMIKIEDSKNIKVLINPRMYSFEIYWKENDQIHSTTTTELVTNRTDGGRLTSHDLKHMDLFDVTLVGRLIYANSPADVAYPINYDANKVLHKNFTIDLESVFTDDNQPSEWLFIIPALFLLLVLAGFFAA